MARLFQRALAGVFLIAFVSLAVQLETLYGSDGLAPIGPHVDRLRGADGGSLPFAPTLFAIDASDFTQAFAAGTGIALALVALLGHRPRRCFAMLLALYLSFVVVGQPFTSFQWDNLLLECGFLALMLPADRRAGWIHFLFRALLFKLYFESGVAKWQSYLHDWHDGSAMLHYYETAPLPTLGGWWAHQTPAAFHAFESRATLAWELILPLLFFGPRRARLAAVALATGFQLVNLATANYGFFVYLALALHPFLLDDRDLAAVLGRLRLGAARPAPEPAPVGFPGSRRTLAVVVSAVYLGTSLAAGVRSFVPGARKLELLGPLSPLVDDLHLVNTYHLFGHITRERIEPEIQVMIDGVFQPRHLRHKPGPLDRAPPWVHPHQPRVDFQLWFYGLSFRRGTPPWVRNLLRRICERPDAVADLFARPLARAPEAVRIGFFRYTMTDPGERRRTGAYWRRQPVAESPVHRCGDAAAPAP